MSVSCGGISHLLSDFRSFCLLCSLPTLLLMAEIRLTTWGVWNPIDNGINYLSTGAGFQPSTIITELPPSTSVLYLASGRIAVVLRASALR